MKSNDEDKINFSRPDLENVFNAQRAADDEISVKKIKKIEYSRIIGAGKLKAGLSFYYYLCAFLLLFILFMAYNISIVAGKRTGGDNFKGYGSYDAAGGYENGGNACNRYNNVFNDNYRFENEMNNGRLLISNKFDNPYSIVLFFALEGAALFITLMLITAAFKFFYYKIINGLLIKNKY